ncbi:adenylate/guanylate cyclase domain-containing protein [Microbacterium sp. P03]|uniref:adenylate/guanylate cyclase domain-containing protein n=1 Tax=Microbacterium sp. P03 TaxID=3366946 RepID=UPI0037466D5C
MDGNHKPYDWAASFARIEDILDQPPGQFEETDALPDRDRLTFTNGFNAPCSALFVDIRDSSGLTAEYTRPELAKLYRAFISEMVAVLNGHPRVREVNIVGDCVWAVYNTPQKTNLREVFSVAARANSLMKMLNKALTARGYEQVRVGMGVDYGRALMIKAGYSGSGLNDVVYMGDVVNRASHLAHEAGRDGRPPVFIGPVFHRNLDDHRKSLTHERTISGLGKVFASNPIRSEIEEWMDSNL